MSATDELRRLLDERGAEWEAWNDCITVVPPSTHYLEVSNGTLCVAVVDATPEQAIAATLGESDEGCYLMRDGKKFPVELDYSFLGIMPISITVGGFRYLLEVPNGE